MNTIISVILKIFTEIIPLLFAYKSGKDSANKSIAESQNEELRKDSEIYAKPMSANDADDIARQLAGMHNKST